MKIGTKVKIYNRHYGRKSLLGKGTYLGIEFVWVDFPHDMVIEKLKKFRIGGAIIYSSDCTWEKL